MMSYSVKDNNILNEAYKNELIASHTYRALANCMQGHGYFGAQSYFLGESADELSHAQKVSDYMNDMGAEAETPTLPAIETDVENLKSALEEAMDMEKALKGKYEKWYENASVSTQIFIIEMIKIQTKSVGEYGDLLARLALTKEPILIDQELAKK